MKMETGPAIVAQSIGKRYKISKGRKYVALRDKLSELISRPFKKTTEEEGGWIWALKDISFTVERGEVVGIIGRNGAGKTTLLKVLSKITRPTEGYAEVTGRVGSLLEVGTGFHPELTGRENIYLNGAILGMTQKEMNSKLEEIIEFAEVRDFIDMPVKRYSTGMSTRLAFSIAAHLEPDILFVDEVLAVGDIKFQKKCLNRMEGVSKSGRTVLFVSHQMNQIRSLCDKVIWIEDGQIKQTGETVKVVASYESEMMSKKYEQNTHRSAAARFLKWRIVTPHASEPNVLEKLEETIVEFELQLNTPVKKGHCGIVLNDKEGQLVCGWGINDLTINEGKRRICLDFPMLPLPPGNYYWRITLYEDGILLDNWNGMPELIVNIPNYQHPDSRWNGPLNIPLTTRVS